MASTSRNNNEKNSSIMDEDWRHLIESSTNLNLSHYATPRIRKSLQGIEAEAHRLSAKSNKHVSANQLKAFAAKAGVNIQHQKQYISSIDPVSPTIDIKKANKQYYQPKQHTTNTMDLHHFLKDHHEYVIASTVKECQDVMSIKFRKEYEKSMEEEWDNTKMEILNYLGVQNDMNQSQHTQQHNVSLLQYPRYISNQQLQRSMHE
eukprot:323722_1